MSGETEKQVSGWTVDTLKEFAHSLISETEKRLVSEIAAAEKANQQRFDAQQQGVKDALTAQKEAVAAALVAAEKAVLVAETNAEKWRMNANEWRGSMLDRETKFAMRTEVEAELKGIRAEMAGVRETFRNEIASLRETRAEGIGSKAMILFLIAVLGAAATVVGIFIATRG